MQDAQQPRNPEPASLISRLWRVPHAVAIPFGVLCIIAAYLLYPAGNATMGYHIGRNLIHTVSYFAILAVIAALLTAGLRRRAVFGYRVFAILFAAAALLDIPTALVKRSVKRQILDMASGLTEVQRDSTAIAPQRRDPGSLPYTPSRIEWLALSLTAEHRVDFSDSTPFTLSFDAVGNSTVAITVWYYPDMTLQQQRNMNEYIALARQQAETLAISLGWSSWLRVTESRHSANRAQPQQQWPY